MVDELLRKTCRDLNVKSPPVLNAKFFTNGGYFTIQNDQIIVELKKKRHLPLLVGMLMRRDRRGFFKLL